MSLANHRQETIPILKNCEPRKSFETTSYSFDENDRRLAEKQFLLSCERGDIGSVRKLLAEPSPGFDLNCVDPLGRNALLIAIENENIEMIELLLDNNIETVDAILYAVLEENVEAVEIIVEHLEKIDKFNPETQGVEINEHSAFTPDITPIILAAHKDNFEIIKTFLDKKGSVPHPHDVRCSCTDCEIARAEDSLKLSRARINAYRALASPSLICLSAKDPILYAFELSWELRRLSYIENEFRTEYQELSQKCQKFSVNMLDQVRGSKELEIVLNHTTNAWEDVSTRGTPASELLSRLKLAIKLRQKRFVAHPNCQQLLAGIWYDGLPGFRNRNIIFKCLLILLVSMSFPLLSVIYLIAPKSSIANFIKKPFIKFLCHSASYIFFLMLIILASQRIDSVDNVFRSSGFDRKEHRGAAPTPVEFAIFLWIIGFIWVEIKQLWDSGLHDYCYNSWNILDFITNALYLCTSSLRLVSYLQVQSELRDPQKRHWPAMPRKMWDAWDPTLVSECVFATANIFSSLKLVHIFTVNPHLGPLKISLGRMVIDILKFFLVYTLVLFSFACGLNQLMWYYGSMRQTECAQYREWLTMSPEDKKLYAEFENHKESCDIKYQACSSIYHTSETLFWAMFGLIDLSHFSLREAHFLTEWTGKTIFGSYSCCATIVLLNMLIAMMSNSYQYISNQADAEWKFARSKLFIEYFDDTATLPPPFNIVPSPKSLYYGVKWMCERFCKCSKAIQAGKQRSMRNQRILRVVNDIENNYRLTLTALSRKEHNFTVTLAVVAWLVRHFPTVFILCYLSLGMSRKTREVFQFVTRNLVKRYIAQMQRVKQQNEGVSEDDVNEIKQDISAFRYELLGILRNAGFNTGHTDINQKTCSRNKKRSAAAERRLKKGLPEFNIPVPESFQQHTASKANSTDYHPPSAKPSPLRLPQLNWRKLKKKVSFRYPARPTVSVTKKSMSFDCQAGPLPHTFQTPSTILVRNDERRKCSISRPPLQKQRRKSSDTVLQLDLDSDEIL